MCYVLLDLHIAHSFLFVISITALFYLTSIWVNEFCLSQTDGQNSYFKFNKFAGEYWSDNSRVSLGQSCIIAVEVI